MAAEDDWSCDGGREVKERTKVDSDKARRKWLLSVHGPSISSPDEQRVTNDGHFSSVESSSTQHASLIAFSSISFAPSSSSPSTLSHIFLLLMLQAGSHDAAGADKDTSCLHVPPSSSSAASTFPAYTQLPHAVADRIIALACRSPEASCSAADAAQRSPLALDLTTTLSLARVSKRISKVTTPLLYESVRVIKPSALLELYDTVSTQPAKAKLIKNLHIGAEETFPTSEWPLSIEEGTEESERPLLRIKTTLGLKEEHRLPKWCTPERTWPCELDRVSESDVSEVAVVQAIISALDYIDLDPYAREYGRSGTHIGPVGRREAVRLW